MRERRRVQVEIDGIDLPITGRILIRAVVRLGNRESDLEIDARLENSVAGAVHIRGAIGQQVYEQANHRVRFRLAEEAGRRVAGDAIGQRLRIRVHASVAVWQQTVVRHVWQAEEHRRNLRIDDHLERQAAIAKAAGLGIRRIDHLHSSREEMAAVGEREWRHNAIDNAIAFEIEFVYALSDLPGIADWNLWQLARLLWNAFIKNRHAEAGVDVRDILRLALRGRITTERDRDNPLARVELIAADRITRHVLQQPRVI